MATGPTQSELEKIRARNTSSAVRSLEGIANKATLLATGEVYKGKPDFIVDIFEIQKTATATEIARSARTWLSDGSYTLTILPFPFQPQGTPVDRKAGIPKADTVADAPFPRFQRATLSNGLKVFLVERHETPTVAFNLSVNTAHAEDFAQVKAGTGSLAVSLMDEGTRTRDAQQLADILTRLGADLSAGGGGEQSSVNLSALKPTLDPALAVFADVIQNPAYRAADVERVRSQQINAIRSAKLNPGAIAGRVFTQLVYGADHPYGRQTTEQSVSAITREDLAAFHARWFKPDNAHLIVVGDTTLAEIVPKLERALGSWRGGGAPSRITVAMPPAPQRPVLYLVDRPGSPQSYVVAGLPAEPRTPDNEFDLGAFNTNFGGNFTSRINMNLRENKGWSYGVRSGVVSSGTGPRAFQITAQIQTDKTKESIQELQKELADALGGRPITAEEIATSANNSAMGLASRWGSNVAVANAVDEILTYNLPETYFDNYATRLKGVTPEQTLAAGRRLLPSQNLVWVVVGDRQKIEPGLRQLGMEIRLVDADGNPVG
jgi:zinc protease